MLTDRGLASNAYSPFGPKWRSWQVFGSNIGPKTGYSDWVLTCAGNSPVTYLIIGLNRCRLPYSASLCCVVWQPADSLSKQIYTFLSCFDFSIFSSTPRLRVFLRFSVFSVLFFKRCAKPEMSTLLVTKYERNRLFGACSRGWLDNIKTNLKKIWFECVDWIRLGQEATTSWLLWMRLWTFGVHTDGGFFCLLSDYQLLLQDSDTWY